MRGRPSGPGNISDSDSEDDLEADRVNKGPFQSTRIGSWTPFRIDCFKMGFSGLRVGPVARHFQISHYNGEQSITDLCCFPIQFHADTMGTLASFKARGRRILDLHGHKSYDGRAFPLTRHEPYDDVCGDIFVDVTEFFNQDQIRKPKLGRLSRTFMDITEVTENIEHSRKVRGVRGREMRFRKFVDHEVDEKSFERFIDANQGILKSIPAAVARESDQHLLLLDRLVPAFVFHLRRYCTWRFPQLST